METSVEGAVGESRKLVPSGAKPIFDAFRVAGVDAGLAYTATRSIQEMVSTIAGEMSQRLAESTQARIDALAREMRAGFKAIEGRLEQHDIRLGRQEDGLIRLEHRLAKQDGRIGGLDDRVKGLDDRVKGLDDRVGGLDGRTAGLEGKIGGLEGKIGGLEGKIGGLEGKIDHLDGQVTAQGEAISGLRGDVRELAGRYQSIDDRLGTLTMVTRWGIALLATALGIGAMVMVQLFVLGRAENLLRGQPIAIEESAAAVPAAGPASGDIPSSGEDGQEADAESPE